MQHDLSPAVSGIKPLVSFCNVFERKHCFDQRPDFALFDHRSQFLETLPLAREHDAVERQIPDVQRRQVSARRKNTGDPAVRPYGPQALSDKITADRIENGVNALSIGALERCFRWILFLVVDGLVDPKILQRLLIASAGRSDDPCA